MGKFMQHLKYTQQELRSYCDDPSACVKCVNDQIAIGLPPVGLSRFQEAVTETVAQQRVGRYDAKLKGIVLDVRNIKVLGNKFPIHNDSPLLHISMRADLYVFEPKIGAVLKGIVKHIAPGHISVTIHRVFNVAIRLSGPKRDLAINNEVTIKITKFDFSCTIPYIEGVLDSPRRIIVVPDGNRTDSGISTEGSAMDSKINGALVCKKHARSSSSDSDSDDEIDANSKILLDKKVTVKQEPISTTESSSESDTMSGRKQNDRLKTDKPSESGSDSEDNDNKAKVIVKTERRRSTESSYSSDESGSKAATAVNIKREASVYSDTEDSDASITPYQKPKSMVKSPPPPPSSQKSTIKSEKRTENLQSSPSPIPVDSTTAKKKRKRSLNPLVESIILQQIRIKTEKALPLSTPSPSTPMSPPKQSSAKKTKHNSHSDSLNTLNLPADRSSGAKTADNAVKLTETSLTPFKKRTKKSKNQVESLLMKVMAHKICDEIMLKSQSTTEDTTTIGNVSQFDSPTLSSTRYEPKSRPKTAKSKKEQLLNKMLSKF